MRILHYTDSHIPPRLARVPVSDYLSKRLTGALNHVLFRNRKFRSVRHKLARLAEFAREHEVDLVLCTGDHTMLGTDRELAEARRLVEPFTRAPLGFITVPGNHDLYTPKTVRQGRFERHFGDLLDSDLPDRAVDGPWPLVRFAGEHAAVVAVNSSIPHVVPWRASGRIPDGQLSALRGLLDDDLLTGRFVFVMTHHTPLLADGRPDKASHGLTNADELMAACERVDRGALLAGHVHEFYRYRPPGSAISIFNAGSATLLGGERLWLFEVEPGVVRAMPGRWRRDGYLLEPSRAIEC